MTPDQRQRVESLHQAALEYAKHYQKAVDRQGTRWQVEEAELAADALTTLLAEHDALRKDAERWRKCVAMGRFPEYCGHDSSRKSGDSWYMQSAPYYYEHEGAPIEKTYDTPNEAIDAALAEPERSEP